MKKTITLLFAAIVSMGLMSFGVLDPFGQPNSTAGHGEAGCTCHSAAFNPAVTVNLTASGTLLTAGYDEGTSYTINVTVTEASQHYFGFDFEALGAANTSVGTLTAGPSGDNRLMGTAPVNVVHTYGGGMTTGAHFHTFSFSWVAPIASTGNVTFYYSGMGANGDGNPNSADHWNCDSTVIHPATTGIAEQTSSNITLSVFPTLVKESTTISYDLPDNAAVSAKLLNVTGQIVSNIFSEEQEQAGKQTRQVMIDPSINAGVYFLAVNINGKENFKKISVE